MTHQLLDGKDTFLSICCSPAWADKQEFIPLSSHVLPAPSLSLHFRQSLWLPSPWPGVESDSSYNALGLGTSSKLQLNTNSNQKNRVSCPVTQPWKVPAPLKTSFPLPGAPSSPQVLQPGQAPPQSPDVPMSRMCLLSGIAQVVGTQSNAIKAQQLNKPAPVSWASKVTSASAFMFLPEASYGKGPAGEDAAFTPGLLGCSSSLCSMSPSHFSWQIQIWECSYFLS